MAPFHPNNLAQNLLCFNRVIATGGGVASQSKGEPTAITYFYIHYAMGNESPLKTTEDDVPLLEY